jgi:photosystem II stability/assembly factor-like uncharacterized protein
MRLVSVILPFLLLITTPLLSQGWEWQNPTPHGNTINDIVMVDPARGVAVCNNGFYMYTADGGFTWTTYRLGNDNLERIIEAKDGSLITVTGNGRVYRSTNMAYSWDFVYAGSEDQRMNSFELTSTPGGTLLAVLNGSNLIRSLDNGQTWTPVSIGLAQMEFEGFRSISVQSDAVWYLANNRSVAWSTDGGENWDLIGWKYKAQGLQRFVFVDSLYGYQLREGQLLQTHDGGETWWEMDIFGFGTVTDVQAGSALGGSVYCLSIGRYLVNASTDNGDSWNISLTETAFADAYPTTIAFIDARTGFVAGDGGRILRTEDGGQSWSIVHGIGYIGTVTDLLFTDENFGVATTYYPTLLLTTDGGRRWNESVPSAAHDCDAIAASPSGTLFLVATTSTYDFDLLRSTDHGESWTVLSRLPITYSSNNPEMAQSILAISDDELLVGVTFGILLRSHDGGATWERSLVQEGINNPYSTGIDIFHFPPSTFIYMQTNGLQFSTDGGVTWEARLTPRVRTIWGAQFISPEIGFGLISGEFSRTTDGGVTWQTTDGLTPQLIHFFDADNGLALWNDPEQDNRTFVMKTSDAGSTWEKFPMGERASYNGWFFLSPTRMWGYGYGGAIRYNGDGGLVSAGGPPALPSGLRVNPGYPHPFSPSTQQSYRIPFTSEHGGALRLALYDLLGREVVRMERGDASPGTQSIDLTAASLQGLRAGTYLYRLTVGLESHTGKLILR